MQSHIEIIQCPECDHIQEAIVEHSIPWHTYVHICDKCKYIIMESEWNVVPWIKWEEYKFMEQFKKDAEAQNPFNKL